MLHEASSSAAQHGEPWHLLVEIAEMSGAAEVLAVVHLNRNGIEIGLFPREFSLYGDLFAPVPGSFLA